MRNNTETIPFSDIYEKNVLSCLFKNEHLTGEDELTEGHFHLPNNRDVYRIIQREKRPIDITKLGEDLRKSDKLDALGGMASIVEIYMFCSITGNFQHEVKELHGFKARRHAIKSAYELIEKSLNLGDDEYIDAAGQPMTLVSDLASAASNTREKKHILTELLEDIESRIKGVSSSMGWPTGIQRIDEKIKGLHECRLVVVSGFPTSGKTVLAIQVCWNLARINIPALIISLEMPDKKIAERNLVMASNMAGITWFLLQWITKSQTRQMDEINASIRSGMNEINRSIKVSTLAQFETYKLLLMHDAQVRGVNPTAGVDMTDAHQKALAEYERLISSINTMQDIVKDALR